MKKISRRNFNRMMGLGILGLAASPFMVKWPADQSMEAILRWKMQPLVIPDEIMTRFLADFRDHVLRHRSLKRYRLKGYNLMLLRYLEADRFMAGYEGLGSPAEMLVTHFVLSTNAATNPGVQAGKKPLKYFEFWHHDSICANPFAEFDYS